MMIESQSESSVTVPALGVDGVVVRFGGLTAVDTITLQAHPGTVTGLIGPNGAGKTTLFNVITGFLRPQAGEVYLNGRRVTHMRVNRRARLGLGRTFQRLELFASLTVRDNVLVAAESRRHAFHLGWRPEVDADEIIERVGLAAVSQVQADTLSTGTIRLLEIARALAMRPSILLLDEPSAGLDSDERARLSTLLGELTSAGLSVLLVEHDIEFVLRVCSHIYVMDLGHMIAEGAPSDIQADVRVQAAYLGAADVTQTQPQTSSTT